jgi:hypothetical protein
MPPFKAGAAMPRHAEQRPHIETGRSSRQALESRNLTWGFPTQMVGVMQTRTKWADIL